MRKMEDNHEASLNELYTQFENTEGKNICSSVENNSKKSFTIQSKWLKKYLLYISLFVWTLAVVIIGQPKSMYKEDEQTKVKKLSLSRIFLTILGIYVTLLSVIWIVLFFQRQ